MGWHLVSDVYRNNFVLEVFVLFLVQHVDFGFNAHLEKCVYQFYEISYNLCIYYTLYWF